jgi:hypothetical protein
LAKTATACWESVEANRRLMQDGFGYPQPPRIREERKGKTQRKNIEFRRYSVRTTPSSSKKKKQKSSSEESSDSEPLLKKVRKTSTKNKVGQRTKEQCAGQKNEEGHVAEGKKSDVESRKGQKNDEDHVAKGRKNVEFAAKEHCGGQENEHHGAIGQKNDAASGQNHACRSSSEAPVAGPTAADIERMVEKQQQQERRQQQRQL